MAAHGVIPQHIQLSGVSGRLLRYLRPFMTNRTFRVRIYAIMSDIRPVTQGVPQGSALSATLFNLVLSAFPRFFPGRFGRTSVPMEIYADHIVLRLVARNKEGSPARAALKCCLIWTVCYLKEQVLEVSTEKTGMLGFYPYRRVLLTRPGLSLHGRRIACVKLF